MRLNVTAASSPGRSSRSGDPENAPEDSNEELPVDHDDRDEAQGGDRLPGEANVDSEVLRPTSKQKEIQDKLSEHQNVRCTRELKEFEEKLDQLVGESTDTSGSKQILKTQLLNRFKSQTREFGAPGEDIPEHERIVKPTKTVRAKKDEERGIIQTISKHGHVRSIIIINN